MWDKVYGVVDKVVNPVTDLIDDVHTSKEEKMQAEKEIEKVKNKMTKKFVELHEKELEAQKEIIVAEAKGSWLQRNWRPILMLSIVAIVVNNYIIYPYLSMFTENVTMLELPKQLWNLMLVGVGGYVAGRSGEKIAGKVSPNHNSNLKE